MKYNDIYSYKQNDYIFIEECSMKCPFSRKWLKCIRYRRLGKMGGESFIREKQDFKLKFKYFNPSTLTYITREQQAPGGYITFLSGHKKT